jgi:iron(III) transport system permease protein
MVGLVLFLVLVVAVLYPLVSILRQSFQLGRSNTTFTLQWYQQLGSGPALRSLEATAVLVIVAGFLSVLVGLVLAWLVERVDVPLGFLARLVPVVPLLIPGVMGAAAWAFLLSPSAGYLNVLARELLHRGGEGPFNAYSPVTIIAVVTVYIVPFTYSVFYPAFRSLDSTIEEAAYIAGAGPLRAAVTVSFGVVRPAVLGAVLLAFVLSMAQFTIPFMLGTQTGFNVLTTRIYIAIKAAFPSEYGVATSTAMVALVPSLAFLALQYRLLRRGGFAVIGGKGGRVRRLRQPWLRAFAATAIVLYAFFAFVLPLLAIVHVSLVKYWTGHLDATLSLDNYRRLFPENAETLPGLRTSALVALIGATLSTALALLVAYVSTRARSRFAPLLDLIATMPSGVPATVFGLACLLAFIRPPLVLYGTVWLMLLAYLVIFMPFAVRPIAASIRQVSPELEDAARINGSSWAGSLARVTFPLVLTAVVASWALLFVLLSREVDASVYLAGAGVNLLGPAIFDLWNEGRAGFLAAYCVIVIAGSGMLIGIAQALPNLGRWARSRGAAIDAAAPGSAGVPAGEEA